ncbi:MAG: zinc-ribbon domain-containing protein, partial [Nitrososphaerales archaeon]
MLSERDSFALPYCMNCGKEIPTGAAFCSNCGKPTTASAASTPVNSTQTFGPATNDPQSLLEARDVIMKKKIMS